MALDKLWAPWRMEFIRSNCKDTACFLCKAVCEKDDRANLVVRRAETCFCVLNRYPYNNGHILVVPNRHEGAMEGLSAEERADIFDLTVEAKLALDSVLQPNGYNMGVNLGRAAGAGLEDHFHLHIVPRWAGDTNFATTIGSTKVIPQALEEIWEVLTKGWEQALSKGNASRGGA